MEKIKIAQEQIKAEFNVSNLDIISLLLHTC